jgi:hypothetical protein
MPGAIIVMLQTVAKCLSKKDEATFIWGAVQNIVRVNRQHQKTLNTGKFNYML